jgi:GPI mannosyltransferase 1 subunit M
MWFLPLIVPNIRMGQSKAVFVASLWVASQVGMILQTLLLAVNWVFQALWLGLAYRLEFLGQQVYLPLWVASVAFFISNNYVLAEMIRAYSP